MSFVYQVLIAAGWAAFLWECWRGPSRKPKPPKHQHLWKINGVRQGSTRDPGADHPYEYFTRVLRSCVTCGEVDIERRDGHWTEKQIRDAYAFSDLAS